MDARSRGNSRNVFYTCSYVPVEIMLAAGLMPQRIIPDPRPTNADAHMHPNTCYYIKSLLASAMAKDAAPAEGIVIANCCDGMRRLYDLWSEYVSDIPAIFLDVPKKKDADSIEFFASELRRFAASLEADLRGHTVTGEALEKAISVCNNVRLLMEEVLRLHKEKQSGVWGMSVFNLCLQGTSSSPPDFAGQLRDFISDPGNEKTSGDERRIVLTGNVVHRPDLIELIENAGGRVVALDTCIGTKYYDTTVKENSSDRFLTLAKRYLEKISCARMEGIEERGRRLKELVGDCKADGVVCSTVKFCDTYLYDIPSMRKECEEAGIPFLSIENDYEWTGLEQMKTRVEAFLDMAGERRSG